MLIFLKVAGVVGGYILGGFMLAWVLYAINFVKYLMMAIFVRKRMTYYDVTDISFVEDGDMLMAQVFWPFAIALYIPWAIWTFATESHNHIWKYGSRLPQWLTLDGWVEYTNRLLGFKEPK